MLPPPPPCSTVMHARSFAHSFFPGARLPWMSCGSASVRVLAQRSLPSRRPSPPRLTDVSLRTVELFFSCVLIISKGILLLPRLPSPEQKIVRVERAGTSLACYRSQSSIFTVAPSLLSPSPTTTNNNIIDVLLLPRDQSAGAKNSLNRNQWR